jgi:hypothetical protein
MNRRAFLRGLAVVPFAAALTPLVTKAPTPRLRDDGYHDDTAMLQAIIDKAAATGQPARFPRGTYRTSKTLTFPAYAMVEVRDVHFRSTASPVLEFKPNASAFLLGVLITGEPESLWSRIWNKNRAVIRGVGLHLDYALNS